MPGNATFYLSDPSMLGSRLFDRIKDIESYEDFSNESGSAIGFVLRTSWGEITLNLMPDEQLPQHLKYFEGYIRSQLGNKDDLIYALSRLHYVRLCIGCVVSHDQNSEEEVQGFLFDFNSRLNGLLFLYDSVWDWSGEPLCGPHKDV